MSSDHRKQPKSLIAKEAFINTQGRDKMAANLAGDTFKWNFANENVIISINILLNFVPKGSIHNKSSLVHAIAWRRTGAKPLLEQMITQFHDIYMRHPVSMS